MKVEIETPKGWSTSIIWAYLEEYDYVETPTDIVKVLSKQHKREVGMIYDGHICFEDPDKMFDSEYNELFDAINAELTRINCPENDPEYWEFLKTRFW